MKKLALALCIVMVSVAGSALALQWEDNMGLYFDEAGSQYCGPLAPGYHVGAAHLVLTNLTTDNGVGGWEAKITEGGAVQLGAFALRGDAINVGTRADEYIVGLGSPLFGDAIVLADFDLYVTAEEPGFLYIDGVYFHSLDNRVPAYLDGADSDVIIEARQSTGGAADPVMLINFEPCGVATEEASWDAVKSLYR